jgi:hypothetical protein
MSRNANPPSSSLDKFWGEFRGVCNFIK